MDNLLESVKAAVVGVLLSVLFAFLLALIDRFAPMGETARLVAAQTLKGLSLAVGCFLSFRMEGGWKKGLLAGVIFTLLTHLSFSAIGGDFSLSWLIFAELFIAILSGIICGAVAVNLRRN